MDELDTTYNANTPLSNGEPTLPSTTGVEDGEEIKEGEQEVEEIVETEVQHRRIWVLGNSGSGKTTLMWYVARHSPLCLFVNPQEFTLDGFKETTVETWKEDLIKYRYVDIRSIINQEQLEDFVTDFHEWSKVEGVKLLEQITLAIDECSTFGVKGKLSRPPWLTTVFTRSRKYYNVIACNHSTYQIGSFYFSNATLIFFMRTGQIKEEQDYLHKRFTPLVTDEQCKQAITTPYTFVVHSVNHDSYQPFAPINI